MATFRLVNSNIWCDPAFQSLGFDEKLAAIESLVRNNPPPALAKYAGPRFRIASKRKRRPDLYTAEWRRTRLRIIREQGTTRV